MGLTATIYNTPALSTEEEPKLRYTYRFRLEAKSPEVFDEDLTKAEVQSYINELLGMKDRPREKVSS